MLSQLRSFRALSLLLLNSILAWFVYTSWTHFFTAGIDDDYITIWSGLTLGKDWWFIDYNGERSEMTSSILAALVAKCAYWINPDAIFLLNKTLLFCFAPAAFVLIWRYRASLFPFYSDISALIAIAISGTMPFFQLWSQSGMEMPLHAFLLTGYAFALIGFLQSERTSVYSVIAWQIALILARQEGFWAIGVTSVMLMCSHARAIDVAAKIKAIIIPLIFFLTLLFVRFQATGYIFPNPVYAKFDTTFSLLIHGYRQLVAFYTYSFLQVFLALGLVFLLGVIVVDSLRSKQLCPSQNIPLIVIALIVLAQEMLFVISGGGFGVFRLLLPTAPLKACLLLIAISRMWANRYHKQLLLVTIAMLSIVYVRYSELFARNDRYLASYESRQGPNWDLFPSLSQMNDDALLRHQAHGRDMRAVYPFIEQKLPALIEQAGELRIATWQAGFFPYYVKILYPDAPVRFFDAKGLMQPEVGLAGVRKEVTGNAGVHYFSALLNGKNKISILINNFNPNMIYVVNTSETEKKRMVAMGWQMVWNQPQAVVWIKPKSD